MKLIIRTIFKIFLIVTISVGCETTQEIKETDPVELFNQGTALLEKDQADRAIAYFNKAIEINPKFAEAYNNRGLAYFMKSRIKKNGTFRKVPFGGLVDKACSDWKRACELRVCKGWWSAKNVHGWCK